MCDHTNDPGGREAAMVVLDPGTPERHGRDGVWCDPCIVPLIKALNDGGIRTIASCCGHGKVYGSIALADGRWLTIMPDADWRAWDARINQAQIATQEPAGATQGGSGDSRASGGLDGAAADTCGAKSEPFLIRDSDQKPVHYLVKTCHLPAGHGRPHHWPVLTFVTPGFTEDAP